MAINVDRSRNKYFYVSPIKSPLQVPIMKTIVLSDYCLVSTDLLYIANLLIHLLVLGKIGKEGQEPSCAGKLLNNQLSGEGLP